MSLRIHYPECLLISLFNISKHMQLHITFTFMSLFTSVCYYICVQTHTQSKFLISAAKMVVYGCQLGNTPSTLSPWSHSLPRGVFPSGDHHFWLPSNKVIEIARLGSEGRVGQYGVAACAAAGAALKTVICVCVASLACMLAAAGSFRPSSASFSLRMSSSLFVLLMEWVGAVASSLASSYAETLIAVILFNAL